MDRSGSFSGKRSFINTAYSNDPFDNADLRKSKIQNLPNFRKTNLGENMPFVVVFQTIEIERLSSEIQSNRVKIKDFERQIFNAQNYQVQIRQLTEKCFAFQMERGKLMQEIEKMNVISQQLYNELEQMKRRYAEVDLTLRDKFEMERGRNAELNQQIERWKARYMAAERSKDKELEDLRQMMQSQRKSMIDRQIRELTLRFQTDRGNLQNEIRKLREGIQYKNRELEQFRQKCQRYEMSMIQFRKSETTVADLNGKINLMNQQISRLNDLLRQKQGQVESGKQNQFRLQQQLKQQKQWEYQNNQLRRNLENRTQEIQDWRIKCGRLEDQVVKGRQLMMVNKQLTSRLETSSRKIDELNMNLKGKVDEVQQWKQRLARQEAQTNKYRNLQNQLRNNESKIGNLNGEIDRLNNVIKSRLTDLQDWKGKCSKLQITVNNYGVVERNYKQLQDKMQQQIRNSQQLKNRINRYEIEINNLRNMERRLEDTDRKNSVLNNEVDRLNNLLRSKTQEIEDLKIKHSKVESTLSQYRNIQVKMQEHEGTIAMLTQEIERLNNILRNKNDEYERLANRCRGLEDQVNFLKAHETKLADNERVIQNLNVTINEFKRNFQNQQEKYRGLENKLRDFESNLYNINQERDRLNGQLKQKSYDFDELRNKYSRLEQEMYHLKEIQNQYRQSKNKTRALMGQQQKLEKVLRQISEQLDQQRGMSNELGCKVIILSAQLQRNSGNTGIKSKQLLEMKQSFYRLQKSCRDKDNEIMILVQKSSSIQKQLQFITGELEKYLTLVTAHERKAKQLQQQIIQYQDYAKRIMILSAQIDRITGENKGLEDDIRKLRLRYADNIAQEKRHQDMCMSFVMLFVEIESLRSRLADRQVSIQQMRKSVLQPVRNIK